MNNRLHHSHPHLLYEWDYIKNSELNLNYFEVTKGSNKKAWWICRTCHSSYDMLINTKNRGNGCPYCSGHKVNETNSIETMNCDLLSEWNFNKNNRLITPRNTYYRSTKAFWWICSNNHEWEASVKNRNAGKGCPYCSGRYAVRGHTDLFTTNPDIAKFLIDKEEGYKLKQFSEKLINWKCLCGSIISNRSPKSVSLYGLGCPKCSKGRSMAEKFIGALLSDYYEYDFENEKVFDWLNNRRYDFYLPRYNTIIEVHGEQHFNRAFSSGLSLEEIQEIDKEKEEKAIKMGVNYITIDARKTHLTFLKTSIIKSGITKFLKTTDINWTKIYSDALKPATHIFYDLYKQGNTIKEVQTKMKISKPTSYKYFKECIDARLINDDGSLLLQSERERV